MPTAKQGSFALVLHAHLPYVLSHGVWPHGTDWLNEAAAECYVPLANAFTDLARAGPKPGIATKVPRVASTTDRAVDSPCSVRTLAVAGPIPLTTVRSRSDIVCSPRQRWVGQRTPVVGETD